MNTRYRRITEYFPPSLRGIMERAIKESGDGLQEIRIRCGKPLIVGTSNGSFAVGSGGALSPAVGGAYIISECDMKMIFQALCENSVYAYMDEIRQGFITIKGGHRVGFTGRAVTEGGKVENFRDISSVNIRISHEVIGAANYILDDVLMPDGSVCNTLIVAPPMVGKTTVLRDLTRQLSDRGIKTAVADDRGEICALYKGVPQNDVGVQTDVIENVPKAEAVTMLLRTMSPQLIITDEIATEQDCKAVMQAFGTGVAVIASTHGNSAEEIMKRENVKELLGGIGFKRIIVLAREGIGVNTRILGKVTKVGQRC